MPHESREWISLHIQLRGNLYGPEGDVVVSEVVRPFLRRARRESWVDRAFFIRYRDQSGPHIRVRLRAPQPGVGPLREALEAHVRAAWPWAQPESFKTSRQSVFTVCEVQWVQYEPEVTRYGGPDAIEVAEAFFDASTNTACEIIERLATDDRGSRRSKALLSMLVLIGAFSPDVRSATHFAKSYASGNLRQFAGMESESSILGAFEGGYAKQAEPLGSAVIEAWNALAARALPWPFDAYQQSLAVVKNSLFALCDSRRVIIQDRPVMRQEAVQAIVPSYLHMMNNRLGIQAREEGYLAHLIARALESRAGAT